MRLRVKQPGQSKQFARGEPTLELRDVLWVPTAPCSLLSEVRLQRAGSTLYGAGSSRQIVLPGGVSVRGTLDGSFSGLFGFRAECVQPAGTAALGALRQPADACAQLWHRRLGHLSTHSMQQMVGMVDGMDLTRQQAGAVSDALCPECAASKQHRQQHTGSQQPAGELLERLHTDVMGPLPPSLPQLGDARYVVTVLDDSSGMCAVQPMGFKGDAGRVVQEVVQLWETSTGKRVKQLRSDRGGEYVSNAMQHWCAGKGIQQQLTPPYTPELNGKAERLNRTLMERVRAKLEGARLPWGFWPEAVRAAAHVIVRSFPAAGRPATPYQLFTGRRPSVAHIRVFGAGATVLVPRHQRNKVEAVSQQGVMVGYAKQGMGWRIWVPERTRVVESADVQFDERPAEQRCGPVHKAAAAAGPPLLCPEEVFGVGGPVGSGTGGQQHGGRQQHQQVSSRAGLLLRGEGLVQLQPSHSTRSSKHQRQAREQRRSRSLSHRQRMARVRSRTHRQRAREHHRSRRLSRRLHTVSLSMSLSLSTLNMSLHKMRSSSSSSSMSKSTRCAAPHAKGGRQPTCKAQSGPTGTGSGLPTWLSAAMRGMMGHAWPWSWWGRCRKAVQKQPACQTVSSGSRPWMRR